MTTHLKRHRRSDSTDASASRSRDIYDTDPFALTARLVDLLNDRLPDQRLCRVSRLSWVHHGRPEPHGSSNWSAESDDDRSE